MDLREFVRDSLVQIQMGVQNAITAHMAEVGSVGVINPVWGNDANAISAEHIQKVEFDIAVTVSSKAEGGAKAGIKVFSVGEISAGGKTGLEESSVSRIKFTVPIVPAVQIVRPAQ
jgi:hypothetical protein